MNTIYHFMEISYLPCSSIHAPFRKTVSANQNVRDRQTDRQTDT